jgi:UDP-glucose 4-epimerase
MGTQRILDLSLRFGVKRVVILSTFHVYGALPDNPVFLKEDSTLRASIKYPELRDVVEMDQIATNWMWKNRDHVETIILRPSNVIGPRLNNTITNYLTSSYAPTGIDFNPMFQFVHEQDMANVLRSCFDKVEPGIYNVAPPDTISIRHAKQIASDGGVPTLLFAVEKMANIIKQLWDFPNYLIHYLMYPCIIDGESLNQQPIEPFQYTTHTALKSLQEIPKD